MNEIDRFFRPINSVMEIPDSDYAKTGVCIAMANALARNTKHRLNIIEYNRRYFVEVFFN